ncbi:AbrB/MazE/SpoVT family DNA-binding domain-containing protein [Entomobacter blattae]|uniref:SpoVT-AbrB domain-containing protein n=1 Tax=Entomobacter blattae TaxID=2762277 RepID=A0A7H1NTS5_9PROT|nr:AbrB/MazE/SpoVT family DNA-binding domain-containing protein [Entomobacter blattae]QNT79185.1 hypothetical protein JGUZn3_19800 [Entomobacter blattae]
MIELKLRKFGNSVGLVLPKEVLEHMKLQEGEKLYLTETPDGSYRIGPYNPTFKEKMNKADNIISRYRNALKVLSE